MLPHDTCREQVSCIIEVIVETVTSEVVRLLEDCFTRLMSPGGGRPRLGSACETMSHDEEESESESREEVKYLPMMPPHEDEGVVVMKSKISNMFARKMKEFSALTKALGEASVEKMEMLLRLARFTETQNPDESLELESQSNPSPVKEHTESESAAGEEVDNSKETFRCTTCDKRFVDGKEIGDHLRLLLDEHNKKIHGGTLQNPDVNLPESQGLESQTISCPESTERQCHQKNQSEIHGGTLEHTFSGYLESRGLQRGMGESLGLKSKGTAYAESTESQCHQKKRPKSHAGTLKKKRLTCPSCEERFTFEASFKMHVCVAYRCPFCPMVFKQKLDGEDSLGCASCGERFLGKNEYYSHLIAHLTDHLKIHRTSSDTIPQKAMELISCSVCQKAFLEHKQLNQHQCLSTFRCTICPAVFKETIVGDAQETADTGAAAPGKACATCGKRYLLGANLIKHLITHLTDHLMSHQVRFKCQLCTEIFFTQEQLNNHLWKHTFSKPFKCQRCGKFSKQQQFAKHINLHAKGGHSLDEVKEPIRCPVCPKTFKTRMALSRHEASHSEEKQFFCKRCDQSFFSAPSFKIHQIQHDRQRICDVCGHICPNVDSLKSHLRSHTGVKPYACDICEKSYKDKCRLKVHRMVHSGEKSFVCKVCDKRFVTERALRKHQFIHTEGKPFACIACNRRFKFKTDLKNHMVVHTGMKPHVCGKCGRRFSDSRSYYKHVREKHSNGEDPQKSLKSALSDEGGKEASTLQVTAPETEMSALMGETLFSLAASNMEATVIETAASGEVTSSGSSEGLLS